MNEFEQKLYNKIRWLSLSQLRWIEHDDHQKKLTPEQRQEVANVLKAIYAERSEEVKANRAQRQAKRQDH